ncbi:NAD-dependent epimerase/dehydratase family protein [Microbacterium sp. W4I20]|uniref:NAD-dependent epimerase/dehydratase family protein n=1 Tax=Microbacterium sp. W4I20 TaxID=3042262 RepID=UPI0027815143|nr:NAD-dependent epimerase/dehydratase family protein [Microbacterium sp. W4I20]MDQ0727827.1 nucleoside-diphosphate-sugar epimerase [Microbacterium sp. W4I20]
MSALRVLFLGGAGMIGSAVAREAVQRGIDLTVVTRGEHQRTLPPEVHAIRTDVRDAAALDASLGGAEYDAVVNWVGFSPAHVLPDVDRFAGRTGQYVFVSTCSVFGRPVPQLPITESSPRRHPVFGYAREKLAAELTLEDAYRERGLPLTIVRPMHTYDETTMIFPVTWTAIERMRRGEASVVHGDGTSLWTLTHSSDVARALVPLLGNAHAIGESVNLVSGDILTWDQIHTTLATAAGIRDPQLAHFSSESIGREVPGWAEVLQEDFRHSILFDTAQLQRLVPGYHPQVSFSEGARRIVAWHEADAARRDFDDELSGAFDRLIRNG